MNSFACCWARRCWPSSPEKRSCGTGGAAGFKADDSDGHCLQNRSGAIAEALEVGTQAPDEAYYSGIDMAVRAGGGYPFVTAHPARIPRYPRAAARMSP